MSFADRLIEAFDGASMAEIARRLDVPHSTIRNYVQNNRLPAADVLIEIANRTNVSLNWLLTGEGEKSNRSRKLDDLQGRLNLADMQAIESLKGNWESRHGVAVSWDDFILTLIKWGENGIRAKGFEERFSTSFEDPLFGPSRQNVLAQSLVKFLHYEITNGSLREAVEAVATQVSRPVENLGTIDDFLADSIRRHDDPNMVLREWWRRDGIGEEGWTDYANKDWDRMTLKEKIDDIKEFRATLEMYEEIDEDLTPNDTEAS